MTSAAGIYYAVFADIHDYLGVDSSTLPDDLLRQPMLRAQRDIDVGCGRWVPYTDTGLKFYTVAGMTVPLTPLEAVTLKEAMQAQVEYRMTVGDEFLIREQYAKQGGQLSTDGTIKKLCGMAYTALGQGGFLKLYGHAERPLRRDARMLDYTNNLSLNRRTEDLHFGDFPRNLGLIPRAN